MEFTFDVTTLAEVCIDENNAHEFSLHENDCDFCKKCRENRQAGRVLHNSCNLHFFSLCTSFCFIGNASIDVENSFECMSTKLMIMINITLSNTYG